MSGTVMAGYVLAAVGLAIIVQAVVKLSRVLINVDVANSQLIKLAKAKNLSRARKLCAAAPGSYFNAVGAAIAAIPKDTLDRVTIESHVHSTFEEIGRTFEKYWRTHNDRGVFGAVVVGAAIGAASSEGSMPPPLWVGAAIAGLATIWVLARRSYATQALIRVRAEVLPAIIDSAVAGGADGKATTEPSLPIAASTPTAGSLTFRIFHNEQFLREEVLDAKTIKIGKLSSAHLSIAHDPEASRMHAVIEVEDGIVSIIDLGSTTGTFVNGEKVTKQALKSGDTILIGATRIELTLGDAPAVEPFRSPGKVVIVTEPNLRDGKCPLCKATDIKTVDRGDPRFKTLVCARCGFAQEFADLAKV